MKLDAIELVRVSMPLVEPFRTSFGVQTGREVLLVRAIGDVSEGWGECVSLAEPSYSSEFVASSALALKEFMAPALLGMDEIEGPQVAEVLSKVKGHRMAKAAIEMAILDADLRTKGVAFSEYLGGVRTKVAVGVSVGIQADVNTLVNRVQRYVAEGYRRVKLKIEPGWDIEPVRAVREALGDEIDLQVDANTAYSITDIRHLTRLDEYNLLLIEQPFMAGDLRAHAELAKRCSTPICLDESVESSADAHQAIVSGACQIVNVKAGRVGGYLEARRVHDVCAAAGVPVWCGGMLETGIGRAANLALASLPNFTLPGDISASNRYYAEDLTDPFLLEESTITVPTGPGLGVSVKSDALAGRQAVRTLLESKTVVASPA